MIWKTKTCEQNINIQILISKFCIYRKIITRTFKYMLIFHFLTCLFIFRSSVFVQVGLSLAGVIVIGMSIGFSFGLSSAAGWEYGPLHSILPFLLLGELWVFFYQYSWRNGFKKEHWIIKGTNIEPGEILALWSSAISIKEH